MSKIRSLDLFAGAGMFSHGLEKTGKIETVAFCEIEPFARKVIAKHWPGKRIFNDVRTAQFDEVKSVGLVTAGFPCQDLSLAGKGAGFAGDNSSLFWYIFRAIRMVGRPKLLLENVAALLRRGMGTVIGALAQIGYDAEWHCIPASSIGAPHNRDRVWIVADPQRDKQSREKPCVGPFGRMGRLKQSVAWDRGWENTLTALRGMDDGHARSVDRTDLTRNALVPQIPELIGNVIFGEAA